jgi:ketosteroid isomerase-like protein
MSLSEQHFEHWLTSYGAAWEAKDSARFSRLFEDNAIYYWAPFEDPKKGRGDIGAAFNAAVGRQRDIDFGARVLYVQANLGAAHWSCSYTRVSTGRRVHLDGIFVVQFGEGGKALSFREWWHTDEK